MEFLLAGFAIVVILFFSLVVSAGNFVWSALETIITWIFYIIFGCISLYGLYKIKDRSYKRDIFVGILFFLLGAAGIFSIADAEGINDYKKQKTIEKEEKLLAKSDCFLSFENLCESEEIESIEIKYTYDKKHDKYIKEKKGKWQQVYPSKGKVYTPEKIPYTKPDYLFTVRIITKDNVKEPVNIRYDDYYFYNIIYFEKAEIDVQDEKNFHFSYNGAELLLESEKASTTERLNFFGNSLVRYVNYSSGRNYPTIEIRSCKDPDEIFTLRSFLKSGYGKFETSKSSSSYNSLPDNIDLSSLEKGEKYIVTLKNNGTGKASKEFIASESNYIEIRDDKIYITEKPFSLKFEFLK